MDVPLQVLDVSIAHGLGTASGWASLRMMNLQHTGSMYGSLQSQNDSNSVSAYGFAHVLAHLEGLQSLKLVNVTMELNPPEFTEPDCSWLDTLLRRRFHLHHMRSLELIGHVANWKRLRYFIARLSQLQNLKLSHIYHHDPETILDIGDFVVGWGVSGQSGFEDRVCCEVENVYGYIHLFDTRR